MKKKYQGIAAQTLRELTSRKKKFNMLSLRWYLPYEEVPSFLVAGYKALLKEKWPKYWCRNDWCKAASVLMKRRTPGAPSELLRLVSTLEKRSFWSNGLCPVQMKQPQEDRRTRPTQRRSESCGSLQRHVGSC